MFLLPPSAFCAPPALTLSLFRVYVLVYFNFPPKKEIHFPNKTTTKVNNDSCNSQSLFPCLITIISSTVKHSSPKMGLEKSVIPIDALITCSDLKPEDKDRRLLVWLLRMYYINIYATALKCTELHTNLPYTALNCPTLHFPTPHYTVLQCTTLHCATLH